MLLRLGTYSICLLFLAGCARSTTETDAVPITEIAMAQATPETLTETEQQVRDLLSEDGIQVVHFWAPWCHNSMSEFREGIWPEIIEKNADVTFIFVTVYNDGALSERTLERYDIPDRVRTFAQPDDGPSDVRPNRRKTFLGLPLTWTPTTWIFHRNGKLAFAVNYGEVRPVLMQSLLENAETNWSLH